VVIGRAGIDIVIEGEGGIRIAGEGGGTRKLQLQEDRVVQAGGLHGSAEVGGSSGVVAGGEEGIAAKIEHVAIHNAGAQRQVVLVGIRRICIAL
jgi:hypothetical protein